MPLFNTYKCQKCEHTWEGIVDVCGRCGGRASRVSGIRQCLDSGKPPGYAGGRTTAHSARSIDKCMEDNFKVMKITNCQHKTLADGTKVPVCTFSRKPRGAYNNLPSWAQNQHGPTMPVRAFQGIHEMAAAGYATPALRMEGQPFVPPAVHPTVQPGAVVGRKSEVLAANTVTVARSQDR